MTGTEARAEAYVDVKDSAPRTWTLLNAQREPYESPVPGTLGGHRPGRIYGQLDCPSARRAIAKGGYTKNRVFFLDEETAIAAGFRPCYVCTRERYVEWKAAPDAFMRKGRNQYGKLGAEDDTHAR